MTRRMNALLEAIVITGLQACETGCTEVFDVLVARFEKEATEGELAHLWKVLDRHAI